MVWAQHSLLIGDRSLVQRNGGLELAGRVVSAGQVGARDQRVRVILAQDKLTVGERALEDRDGVAKVAARGKGVGVIAAQDPLPARKGALVLRDRVGQPPGPQQGMRKARA